MPFYNNASVVAYDQKKNTNSLSIMCIFDFGNQIVSG
nr:MAG TPA: hypothetical protein [Caudoviricetes sp.]